MNLAMLLAWEQIYHLKVKNDSNFSNEQELTNYLKNQKQLDEGTIQTANKYYEFASTYFTKEQWGKVEELFLVLEDGRSSLDFNAMMDSIGTVLWEMGNLFGTNPTAPHLMN